MDYNNKIFRPVSNSATGAVTSDTTFHYRQSGPIVTAEYAGGGIILGHLIALADEAGHLDMRYHQVNEAGELQTGICHSTPELLPDGRIRLFEKWQWTNGSKGESVLEQVVI